jgi:hypothetical protein
MKIIKYIIILVAILFLSFQGVGYGKVANEIPELSIEHRNIQILIVSEIGKLMRQLFELETEVIELKTKVIKLKIEMAELRKIVEKDS